MPARSSLFQQQADPASFFDNLASVQLETAEDNSLRVELEEKSRRIYEQKVEIPNPQITVNDLEGQITEVAALRAELDISHFQNQKAKLSRSINWNHQARSFKNLRVLTSNSPLPPCKKHRNLKPAHRSKIPPATSNPPTSKILRKLTAPRWLSNRPSKIYKNLPPSRCIQIGTCSSRGPKSCLKCREGTTYRRERSSPDG